MWIGSLEAIELLGLLAIVSKPICWSVLVDISYEANKLKRLGWTLDLFHGIRPRFEFQICPGTVPTDEILELILHGIPDGEHTVEYTRVRTLLIGHMGDRPYDPVVPLRFHFTCPDQTANERDATHRHSERRLAKRRYYVVELRCLKRVHSMAIQVAASRCHGSQGAGPIRAESFGLQFSSTYVTDDARECLRAIAAKVPISSLAYGVSSRQHDIGNYYGPFLWRLLAPHPLLRPHIGVQKRCIDAKGILGHAQIIALCSALAQSKTLQTCSFTEDAESSDADAQAWASWLAFALFSPASRHRIRKVHLHVANKLELYAHAMEQVLGRQQANPVAYLALGPDTGGVRKKLVTAAVTVYHGRELVQCHAAGIASGHFMPILIPGVGFGYVDQQDVVTTQPTPTTTTHTVRSLSLSADGLNVERVRAIEKLIGQPLTSLSLSDTSKSNARQGLDASRLVGSCHDLRRLRLDNLAIPAESLTTAADWGRKLQSLVLESVRLTDTTLPPKVPLADTRARREVFPNMSSIFVRMRAGQESLGFQQFPLEMVVRPRLERIVVAYDDPTRRHPFYQHSNLDGLPIVGLPPRTKLAFRSVVSARSEDLVTAKHALTTDTIAQIFEMAASLRTRTIVIR